MFRSLISLLIIAGLSTTPLSAPSAVDQFDPGDLLKVEPIPRKTGKAINPIIEAKSALLMDVDSGIVLYKKNSEERLPMASLTKIMTDFEATIKELNRLRGEPRILIKMLPFHNYRRICTSAKDDCDKIDVACDGIDSRFWFGDYNGLGRYMRGFELLEELASRFPYIAQKLAEPM